LLSCNFDFSTFIPSSLFLHKNRNVLLSVCFGTLRQEIFKEELFPLPLLPTSEELGLQECQGVWRSEASSQIGQDLYLKDRTLYPGFPEPPLWLNIVSLTI
jgi:hypothetical protein